MNYPSFIGALGKQLSVAWLTKGSSAGFVSVMLGCSFFNASLSAQTTVRIDFAKDVRPVLQANCLECHGPKKQKAGMRLDRRSSAMKPFSRRIVPGNSPSSMLYERLIGDQFGQQMPPKGEIRPEQIAIIKQWIEQGADWPDWLANETELPPVNPKASAMVEELRNDDLPSFLAAARADPTLLNTRGPEGSTPFMYAVLYSDTSTLAKLLKLGADPNKHNDGNATALMWAARNLKKTRLLIAHGADVNAESDYRRTPLMIAARKAGAVKIVKLLLDNGANPNPNSNPLAESSPLLEALMAGDAAIIELLLQHGADGNATADQGLSMAMASRCDKAVSALAAKITDTNAFSAALTESATLGDLKSSRLMLERGADVNAFDPFGKTALMYAAGSDTLPLDVVKLLIEYGADVKCRVPPCQRL
ncbi:MAG TPA: ankyrin repeat domain-containing protein [Verrucomicrobiae bacterium]|jgi:ankyrin repeat protein